MRNHNNLSGYFMLAFLAYAGLASGMAAFRAAGQLETPGLTIFAHGEWARAYEKKFDAALPASKAETGFWAALNYRLFGAGKKGVLIGGDGWLFTSEEFAWPADAQERISIRAAMVSDTRKTLEAHGSRLIVALLPAKARICRAHLGRYHYPSYNEPVYGAFRRALAADGIAVPDILAAMNEEKCSDLFLRTDTHWKPAGAELAAQEIAAAARLEYKTGFKIEHGEPLPHEGDLIRYIPGLPGFDEESVESAKTVKLAGAQTKETLFGDERIPVALVGTSYSANPLWNFSGFLEAALHTDVINAAEEGQGPFETMKAYLAGAAFRDNPPELVIWEIPERYLVVDAEGKAP